LQTACCERHVAVYYDYNYTVYTVTRPRLRASWRGRLGIS